MFTYFIKILPAWTLLISSVDANQNTLDVCLEHIKVDNSNNYSVEVKNSTIRHISPQFFGFNINWFGFQRSYWDNKEKHISNSIINYLKQDFIGAIYRYPGGLLANRFDWESSIGTIVSRSKQQPVKWHNPLITKFGYQEYLDFVRSVGGKPWIVNNLYGKYDKEEPIGFLKEKASKWSKYSLLNKQNIERWELGNELDRGRYNWSAEKYSSRAINIAEAIKLTDHNAKFVAMLRDYYIGGHGSESKYNRQLANKLNNHEYEYALHQYYDGPSVPNLLSHICSSINDVEQETEGTISIWITEHARWPRAKKPIDWKKEWPQTCNLQSAISVADYIVAVSQIPEVKGAFIHSLSKVNSPWTLFLQVNNRIRPSLVYRSLQLLRKSMLSEVLDIDIQSKNKSDYHGGYDFRASVQTNPEHTKYTVWMVNRASSAATVTFTVPQLASKIMNAAISSLSDSDLERNSINTNTDNELLPISIQQKLAFSHSGLTSVTIPGYSITTLSIY